MARIHYWQFLSDSTGSPVYGANIGIYLAASEAPAAIYLDEIGGDAIKTAPQLKTDVDGFFEFWIGDSSEKVGYSASQKFKITWERIGVESGMIDYVDIFPATMPVDTNSDNAERNKSVSDLLAKGWEQHRLSTDHVIHGIQELNMYVNTTKRNKLVSNRLGILWNKHRLFNFNTETMPPSADDIQAAWEDSTNSDLYGAHGLRPVEVEGEKRSNTVYNKLLCNALANKWDEHVNFNFSTDTVPMSGLNGDGPHGLEPVNLGDLPDNPTEEQLKAYNSYNRLMSNRLMKNILLNLQNKPTTFIKKIKKEDWVPSLYEQGVYQYKVVHGLGTKYIGVSLFHDQERFTEDGQLEMSKAIFSAEDIYILNENTIEISVTELADVELLIFAHTDQLVGIGA